MKMNTSVSSHVPAQAKMVTKAPSIAPIITVRGAATTPMAPFPDPEVEAGAPAEPERLDPAAPFEPPFEPAPPVMLAELAPDELVGVAARLGKSCVDS